MNLCHNETAKKKSIKKKKSENIHQNANVHIFKCCIIIVRGNI